MPKDPSRRPVKRSETMTGAMKFFLAGCVAELYLLIVRRCYIHGNAAQMIAWYDHYLFYLCGAGVVLAVAGGVLSALWRTDARKRPIGWYLLGGGVFLASSALLIRALNASAVTLLSLAVPVVMLLGILWDLYDRECALSLTILGSSLLVLWACRRGAASSYFRLAALAVGVLWLAGLAAVVLLARKAQAAKGKLGKVQVLAPGSDYLPVYTACGLSAVGVLSALVSTALSYYTMWGLAIVVFALAVYYTVKQL